LQVQRIFRLTNGDLVFIQTHARRISCQEPHNKVDSTLSFDNSLIFLKMQVTQQRSIRHHKNKKEVTCV
jgi:hypothetical protein